MTSTIIPFTQNDRNTLTALNAINGVVVSNGNGIFVNANASNISNLINNNYEPKGTANLAIQSLNANNLVTGTVPLARLPISITSNVRFLGLWNGTTVTGGPLPITGNASAVGKGSFYIVSQSNSTNVDGTSVWNAGDSIISDGQIWDKIVAPANYVLSVNGLTASNGNVNIPAYIGDVSQTSSGSDLITVVGINGTKLSDLGTGLLKNHLGTGIPSIASSLDIQNYIGPNVYDPYGTASALVNSLSTVYITASDATQIINTAINGLSTVYDPINSAATAQSNAQEYTNAAINALTHQVNTSYAPLTTVDSVISGTWYVFSQFFRLQLNGTGSITMDSKDTSNNITVGVYSNTVVSVVNEIDYPYPGPAAVQIRINISGNLTVSII